MLKGRYIILLTVFSLVSLVGTGFSSWVVTKTNIATINITAQVAEVLDLISMNNTENKITICKYGFLYEDNTDSVNHKKIITSYSYNYSYSFNQAAARKGGYINNDSTNFYVNISRDPTSNNFISLFANKYYTASVYIKYNNSDTSTTNLSVNNNMLSSTISLNNVTQNDNEAITFVITFTLDETKVAVLGNYLKTQDITKGFDFITTIGVNK